MYTRLVELFNSYFSERKLEEKNKNDSIKKLNAGKYSRVFNGFTILNQASRAELSADYIALLNEIINQAMVFPDLLSADFKKISNIEHSQFFSNHSNLADYVTFFDLILKDKSINDQLLMFSEKIISMAMNDLLDGRQDLRWDVVTRLKWESFKEVHDKTIVQAIVISYYQTVCEEISVDLCSSNIQAGFRLANMMVNRWMTYHYIDHIKKAIDRNQQTHFCSDLAAAFVQQLLALNPNSLAANLASLKDLVLADLNTYKRDKITAKEKVLFWINVMFDCGLINNKQTVFYVIFNAFQHAITCEKNAKSDVLTNLLDTLDARSKSKYMHCFNLAAQHKYFQDDDNDSSIFEIDEKQGKMNASYFKVMLQGWLDARDKYTVINLLIQDYLATLEPTRLLGEMNVLKKILGLSESVDIYDNKPLPTLLSEFQQMCCKAKVENGILMKIITSYQKNFSRSLTLSSLPHLQCALILKLPTDIRSAPLSHKKRAPGLKLV